jgi:hypothetical protein
MKIVILFIVSDAANFTTLDRLFLSLNSVGFFVLDQLSRENFVVWIIMLNFIDMSGYFISQDD